MALQLISPPQVEPVSLAEIKEFLRVDSGDTSQDDVLYGLQVSARAWCEAYTQRRCIAQTWRLLMDFFPGYIDLKLAGSKVSSPFVSGSNAILVGIRYAIVMPYSPVQSITLFQYLNANGTTTPMTAGTDYTADIASSPARLAPPFGQMWPVARVVPNAVQVDYVVGYGTAATVSIAQNAKAITGATFTTSQIGEPISIPGAGVSGGQLNTIIAAVDGGGNATARDAASTTVTSVSATVNMPEGFKTAIKLLINKWYETRVPDDSDIPMAVKAILGPFRDLRY